MRFHAASLSLIVLLSPACGQQDRRDNKRLSRDNDDLHAQLAAANNDKATADANAAQAQSKASAQIATEQQQAAAKVKDAQDQVARAKVAMTDAAAKLKDLQAAKDADAAKLAAAQKDQEAAAAKVKDALDQLASAKTALTAANDKEAATEAKLAAAAKDQEAAAANLKLLQAAKATVDANLAASQQSISELNKKVTELNANVQTLTSQKAEADKASQGLSLQLDQVRASLKKAAVADALVSDNTALVNNLDAILKQLVGQDSPTAAQLRADLRTVLQLPATASDDDVKATVAKINFANQQNDQVKKDLQKQLDDSKAALADQKTQLGATKADLDKAIAAKAAIEQANAAAITDGLNNFAGLWIADKKDLPNVNKDCRLFLRVTSKPNAITRAVACADGHVETLTYSVDKLMFSSGDFTSGLAIAPQGSQTASSCAAPQVSRTAALDALVFNTATHSGASPASMASATFAGQTLGFTYGASDDDLKGISCDNIASALADADKDTAQAKARAAAHASDESLKYAVRDAVDHAAVLRLAASVCQATPATTGCMTAAGFEQATSH